MSTAKNPTAAVLIIGNIGRPSSKKKKKGGDDEGG